MSYYNKALGLVPPGKPIDVGDPKEVARLRELGFIVIGREVEETEEEEPGESGETDGADAMMARMEARKAAARPVKPGGKQGRKPAAARARKQAQAAGLDPDEYPAREK